MADLFLYLMMCLYVVAGLNHFISTRFYMKIMPPAIPYHLAMVYISGIAEIVLALLLLPLATRHVTAWLIIIMLIAIFPANVYMAQKYWRQKRKGRWLTIARLPLQLPLIYWAWLYT